uniref:DUF5672 domain-containing protein n=1 Tax=Coccolithus braarudii TaxID=221442 RepID=A0A7S0Q2W2_9EUKA|mmetsp:Transcript_2855/g.5954  ORF Transcript_2855/g.5954 Transcript_2855/m.5954 type:complete len:312 (+) Transcript_2855:3-938(+)
MRELWAHRIGRGELTLTNLGTDYMEDWQRLSSMMLLAEFWRACVGKKVLIFQPDSIMCTKSSYSMNNFLQYDFVGAPMAGAWWSTSDHPSQWGVGCGGFSLRDRHLSIEMANTPECITLASGKLEDQQLGASWQYIEKRCKRVGITVNKPDRHLAVKFAVEYDLYMDVLPGDDPAMPGGCSAKYYTGPKYTPGGKREKWDPHPRPADTQCERPFFVPLGCHKCWFWNWRTWRHMKTHCPEAVEMRRLRKEYKVGVEFTGWPTRPRPKPIKGPAAVDSRFLPADMIDGTCHGHCLAAPPNSFEKTVLGKYHQ